MLGNARCYTPAVLKVFISHSSGDAAFASQIVDLLEKALHLTPAAIRCTTVDGYGLAPGAVTDETLKREIFEADSFIALLTPSSLKSMYVLFELGARWGAGRHFVPLLLGAEPEALDGPLRALNVLKATNESHIHALIESVAAALGIPVQRGSVVLPRVRAVREAAESYHHMPVRVIRGRQDDNADPGTVRRFLSTGTVEFEDRIREVCLPVARDYGDFHVDPHIPPAAASRLRQYVYGGPEPVLAVVDTTERNTGETGVALTRSGVHWRNPSESRTHTTSWTRLRTSRIRANNEERSVILGPSGIVELSRSWVTPSDLALVLRRIAASLF